MVEVERAEAPVGFERGNQRASTPSRSRTGRNSARPTRSSGSTARSAAAPTSSASFPNDRSAIRLAGALLIEQNDEWLVGRRYLSVESLALLLVDEDERQPAREEVRALQPA